MIEQSTALGSKAQTGLLWSSEMVKWQDNERSGESDEERNAPGLGGKVLRA